MLVSDFDTIEITKRDSFILSARVKTKLINRAFRRKLHFRRLKIAILTIMEATEKVGRSVLLRSR